MLMVADCAVRLLKKTHPSVTSTKRTHQMTPERWGMPCARFNNRGLTGAKTWERRMSITSGREWWG